MYIEYYCWQTEASLCTCLSVRVYITSCKCSTVYDNIVVTAVYIPIIQGIAGKWRRHYIRTVDNIKGVCVYKLNYVHTRRRLYTMYCRYVPRVGYILSITNTLEATLDPAV
jgi:hypothetical protein